MRFFKINIIVLSVFIVFTLIGCQDKSILSESKTLTSVEETDETMLDYSQLFELKLYSDKSTYSTSDKINIWATLQYIGKNSHIKIWHGNPYINFYISDGKDFNIGGLVHDVLKSTELENGKLYSFDYSKNGGYDADDPKADFWREFYAGKDLFLPEGEYTIKVSTAFSLDKDSLSNKSSLFEELKIVVKPGSANIDANKQNDSKLSLIKNEIQQINISCSLPLFKSLDITDTEHISTVVDYLNALNPIHTKLNPGEYTGMAYVLKTRLKNGSEREFTLSGNKFFMEAGGFTSEIPYNEAIIFDTIVANMLEDNQAKNGEPSIIGTVISIKSQKSGRNISCVIKDSTDSEYIVDLKSANIIDSTGNGWMILHEKDVVKIFYEKSKQDANGSIVASSVYIKESTK